jgi:hypothetical protein
LPLERARRILDPHFHPGTEPISYERRAIHSTRKASHPFVGLDATQRTTHRRAPAFFGLCSGDRPDEPVMGWGVVLVSGGRLSYLQHGLLRPGSRGAPRADVLTDLLAAYRPVAVASVEGERAPIAHHGLALGAPLLRYGVADLLRALAPRASGRSLQEDTAPAVPGRDPRAAGRVHGPGRGRGGGLRSPGRRRHLQRDQRPAPATQGDRAATPAARSRSESNGQGGQHAPGTPQATGHSRDQLSSPSSSSSKPSNQRLSKSSTRSL